MVGAWEQNPPTNEPIVTIAIPHREICHVRFALGLARLLKPAKTFFSISKGHPWDLTRNGHVQDALNNGSTHILFYDSDIDPPAEGLNKLLSHNMPVVSGLYYCRHRSDYLTPESLPVPLPATGAMWLDNGQGAYNPIINWTPGQLVQCSVVGCGFALIHMSVFRRLDKELNRNGVFFKWTAGVKDTAYTEGLPGVSEDFFFFRMLARIGIPIMVDTSIICNHMSMAAVVNQKGLDFSAI